MKSGPIEVPQVIPQAPPGRFLATVGVLVAAVAGSMLVALANQPWFDLVNGYANAIDPVARGLLFSSWLLLVGGVVVVRRPATFGFRRGLIREELPLIAIALAVIAVATVVVLKATGSTPYSDASLFIEAVDVPVTEELVFRAVLLTVLLRVLGRLHAPLDAARLAIVFDGIAFGSAHLANAAFLGSGFVVAQAVFAAALGCACAFLMVRTRSVYPAMVAHAVVNTIVVLV